MGNQTSKTKLKAFKHKEKPEVNLVDEEDIILKCGLEEMVKRFFKDYVIVWHDPNVNSQENKRYLAQLEKFCEVKPFTEWEKASMFVRGTTSACHVITSGKNGEVLVKEICPNVNVLTIYVFCGNRDFHSIWARNYSKVKCVETDIQQVLSQIEKSLLQWYKEASSLRMNLPAFAPFFNDWDKSEMNNLHRYLKVMPGFKNREQAKRDLVNLAKEIYSDETNMSYIASFDQNYNEYNKEAILRWYTQESFLYKITNNCLRIATSDSIQYCRLLLKDIERAIKEQYHEKSKHFCGVLYRGAYLSREEWKKLKENLNKEIEMHGFLSVSKVKNVALHFMQENSNQKVFITILVPKGPKEEEQGFAEIEEFSKFPQEKEILFNVRSRFTVLEAEDVSSEGGYRHLVLLYGAQGFRRFVTEENSVQEIFIPNVENLVCSICNGHRRSTKMFFKPLTNQNYLCSGCLPEFFLSHNSPLLCLPIRQDLKINLKGLMMSYPVELKLPMYGYKCGQCQAKYRQIYFKCTECNKVFCENCTQINCIKEGHGIVLESNPFSFWCERMSENELSHLKYQAQLMDIDPVFQQAEMYFESNQYERAIQYNSIYIQQHNHKKKDLNLSHAYHNIARCYEYLGDYNKALEFLLKSLKIYKSCDGHTSSGISSYYANLGVVYESLGDYKKSLKYLEKSLKTIRSIEDEANPTVAASETIIGEVYLRQGEVKKSLECFEKALEIAKSVFENAHPNLACCYNNVGNIYEVQGELSQALEYFGKALEIARSLYGDNHPEVALYSNNIGGILLIKGELTEAWESTFKALEIYKPVCGEDYYLVASCYNNLGEILTAQGDYAKALEYHNKALKTWNPAFRSSKYRIAKSYNNLGVTYEKLGEYQKALEHHERALEIRKSIYREGHYEIATSYNNIGSLLYHQGNFTQALDYLYKALEMRRSFFGENHYELATSYNNIGLVYDCMRQENKALEFYKKALKIRRSVFGENHILTYEVRNQIKRIGKYGKNKPPQQNVNIQDLEIRKI